MAPVFPSTIKLFEEKNCRINRFDTIFNDVISAVNEGYFTISEKGDIVYLFVVGGKPYASGRIEKEGPSFLHIQEFFDTYSRIGAADLAFYKVEKKLLLGMLVYFKKRPLQKLNDDAVDIEKVLNDLKAKGADSMIVTMRSDKMGFCICLKGSPSFSYLPDGAYAQEQPKDGLLLYISGEKKHALSLEIFDDIQMKPAPDAIPVKDQLPKSLIGHYKKSPPSKEDAIEETILLEQPLEQPVVQPQAKPHTHPPVESSIQPEEKPKPSGPLSRLVLEDGKELSLQSTVITIGSDEDMGLRLGGRGVAKHQASILRGNGGKFILVHKGGRMPTKVNGNKIEQHQLKNGDAIEIGQYKISYKTS